MISLLFISILSSICLPNASVIFKTSDYQPVGYEVPDGFLIHYLINCFLPKGRRNHKTMAKQSTRNYEALKAHNSNPEIAALLQKTESVFNNYHQLLTAWVVSIAHRAGSTQGFQLFLKDLRAKISGWDLQIQLKYKKKTAEYKTIFPKGISYILEGTQEEIITKFKAFYAVVTNYGDLDSIKSDINDAIVMIDILYGTKNAKSSAKNASTADLDDAHDAMGKALYYNLLQLTAIFIDDTTKVEDFFDMSLLRTPAKDETPVETSMIVSLPANTSVDSGLVITVIDKFLLMNKSAHSLQFYGASTPTELPKTAPREIVPGEEIEVTGAELGAPANKYLIFINPSTTATGEIEILQID